MKLKSIRLPLIAIVLACLAALGFSISSVRARSLPPVAETSLTAISNFHLEIPSINAKMDVIAAHFAGKTWDFNPITYQAAYLEGMPLPGDGGNALIGAHSELAKRHPGPFYNLNKVQRGDQIIVTRDGVRYTYTVSEMWTVPPTDVSILNPTSSEVLTLLTCSGYTDGTYATRLIVRATRTS